MEIKSTLSLISKIKEYMNNFIIKELEKNGAKGIVPSHGEILISLYRSKQKLTMKDIAGKINRTQPTVTVLVHKLEKLGYLKRSKSIDDGRSTDVELTKKGRDFKDVFFKISEKMNDKLHENLSEKDQKNLELLLKKILSGLD